MRKRQILVGFLAMVLGIGVGYAAFGDKAEILGTSVSVSSADIKLLDDLGGGIVTANLVDSKVGPLFDNISPGWVADYPVALFNDGTSELLLNSVANYDTANDVSDLRQDIYVEPITWVDSNNDGIVDVTELGLSFGQKTVVKWKTEGFDLGPIGTGEVKSYVLRFSAVNIPDSKQGASALFDFEFNALSQ